MSKDIKVYLSDKPHFVPLNSGPFNTTELIISSKSIHINEYSGDIMYLSRPIRTKIIPLPDIDISLFKLFTEKYIGCKTRMMPFIVAEILDRLEIELDDPFIRSIDKYRIRTDTKHKLLSCQEKLEQTLGLLDLFMPKEEDKQPTEEEELAQADTRAKQGAIKHREAQKKMRELMRSPEAESIRLQESEYPSIAQHILRAGRRTRRIKK